MLHSTAGVRQLRCYAERGRAFAELGIAALQFDCRGFGASEGEPRQLFDVRRQAEDLEAALERARGRADVDGKRLALWGGSASCAQVLDAARRPAEVDAVVCLTPFVPGRETQRSAGTPVPRLAAAAPADRLRMLLGREPRGVAVGGEPGETAILVREDAAVRERAMLPRERGSMTRESGPSSTAGTSGRTGSSCAAAAHAAPPARRGRVPRRSSSSPARRRPLPAGPGGRARPAPRRRARALPLGHFDLYAGRSIAVEAEFLRRHLSR